MFKLTAVALAISGAHVLSGCAAETSEPAQEPVKVAAESNVHEKDYLGPVGPMVDGVAQGLAATTANTMAGWAAQGGGGSCMPSGSGCSTSDGSCATCCNGYNLIFGGAGYCN